MAEQIRVVRSGFGILKDYVYVDKPFKRNQLERLNIMTLLGLAKMQRPSGKSFKAMLIDYLVS